MAGFTPDKFFAERRPWFEDADAVQVGELSDGSFAVFLKLDGNYRVEADAKKSAASMRRLVKQSLRSLGR